jgi:D-3-phosphoglycerate dehydrogenase
MLYTDAGEFRAPEYFFRMAGEVGIEVKELAGHEPAEIAAHGQECDGLFLFRGRVDDALLAALPRCRLLARIGTGYDRIDVDAARRRSVMVTYAPDFCTEELSDHVLMFILAFARKLPQLLWERHWLAMSEVPMGRRLAGRTLGILGFGRSGQRTAEKARAFNLVVRAWSRTLRPEALARTGVTAASFQEALACDYISLHLPLTPQTERLIDREALALVKPESVLINISRGAIVDTDALVEALRAGRLAGAGLDVVEPAPLPPEHPLWTMPNVLLTSHSAANSPEGSFEALSTTLADAAAVLGGRMPKYPVPELRAE